MTAGGIGIVQFLAVFPAIIFVDRLGTSYHISLIVLNSTF